MADFANDFQYKTVATTTGPYKVESTRDGRYRFCKSMNGQFFLPQDSKVPDGVYSALVLHLEQQGKDGTFRVVGVEQSKENKPGVK